MKRARKLQAAVVLNVDKIPRPQASSCKKEIMRNGSESIKVLINHWRWLEANGYKQQAASCKLQAASLTRKQYRIIKEYENKRST